MSSPTKVVWGGPLQVLQRYFEPVTRRWTVWDYAVLKNFAACPLTRALLSVRYA